jgi:di/tricarboxylate transporter
VVGGWPPLAVLLVMFTVAGLLTQILSDAATAVLRSDRDRAGAVAGAAAHAVRGVHGLGAVVAFLTPIGHHGNLLILGPGSTASATSCGSDCR